MAEVDENYVWRPVQPTGLALGLVIVTVLFVVLTSIVVPMRLYIRRKLRNFGWDDWTMGIGYVSGVVGSHYLILLQATTNHMHRLRYSTSASRQSPSMEDSRVSAPRIFT